MLTRAEIDDILKLIDGSDFTELKLEMGDLKLELRKGGAVALLRLLHQSRFRLHRFRWRPRLSPRVAGRKCLPRCWARSGTRRVRGRSRSSNRATW